MNFPFVAEVYRTRTVPGGTNEYGVPLPAQQEEYLALTIPCNWWGNMASLRGSQGAPVVDYTMIFPFDTDLTTNDTIRSIRTTLSGDDVMSSGSGQVLDVAPVTLGWLKRAQVSWVGA